MTDTDTAGLPLAHPELQRLLVFWHGRCADGRAPIADLLDPADLRPWLGNLLVMDVETDGAYTYAYYGDSLALAFGGSLVGHSLDALPLAQSHLLTEEYERVRAAGAPVSRTYRANFDGRDQTWERLVLPLGGADGGIVKLLVAAYPIG